MGKEQLEQAVGMLADDAVRDAVLAGDLSTLGVELTDEEQAMVAAAAADYPDVAGFAFDFGLSAKPGVLDGGLKCNFQARDVPGTPRPKMA